jgi:NAD-dependent deacetylase
MDQAYLMASRADLFIVVGTSLAVYPAAGLVDHVPDGVNKYLVDPGDIRVNGISNLRVIKEKASTGLSMLAEELLSSDVTSS